MKRNMRLAVELIFVAALASTVITDAATYNVGDGSWKIPSTAGEYDTWAAKYNFTIGDVLVFTFTTAHDVATVTKAKYDSCDGDSPIAMATQSPASITLTTSGMNYFICAVSGHCEAGQKLAVNVTTTTSTGGATPPSSSTTPNSAPSPTTPSAAPALAGASFFAAAIGFAVMGMVMV